MSREIFFCGQKIAFRRASAEKGDIVYLNFTAPYGRTLSTVTQPLPKDMLEKFKTEMERSFGKGCVTVLRVRPYGAVKFK